MYMFVFILNLFSTSLNFINDVALFFNQILQKNSVKDKNVLFYLNLTIHFESLAKPASALRLVLKVL